jgi:glycine/D-amino acid oxidase-like deaminating enzyme
MAPADYIQLAMRALPSETDFIVVGAGIAGLRASVELASAGRVLCLAKQEVTESNTQSPIDNQTDKAIDSLKYEIASLESQLRKREDRIASLEVMLKQVMQGHTIQVRGYEDAEHFGEETVAANA